MVRPSLTMTLLVLLVGCYRHVPTRIEAVAPGTEVRLRLSNEGAERLEEITGMRRAQVDGELIQWAKEVIISLPMVAPDGRNLQQRISVEADQVIGVDVRELDRTRTALLVGGAGAVVGTAIVSTIVRIVGGSQGGQGPLRGETGAEPSLFWGFGPAFLRGFP